MNLYGSPAPGAEARSERPRILIVTSHTGGGHLSLALALQDMLGDRCDVTIADPHPGFVQHYYTFVSRHFLRLWGFGYRINDSEHAARRLHRILEPLTRRRLRVLLDRVQPQLIINTHTLLSYAIARSIERSARKIPLVFQFSELEEVHATWLTVKDADAYLVPTEEIAAQARARGIDAQRLHLTGMPVRSQFLHDYSSARAETRTALGLDPALFTVFLQGGAEGAARIGETVSQLLAETSPLQIMLAAGTNARIAQRFAGMPRVGVLPFTRSIARFMAAADVVAGKAGPNCIAEAAMLGKPFVATTFIPGQEAPNLAFLERHNLGWVCLEAAAQRILFSRLAAEPSARAEKTGSIQAYRTRNEQAYRQVRPLIDRLIGS